MRILCPLLLASTPLAACVPPGAMPEPVAAPAPVRAPRPTAQARQPVYTPAPPRIITTARPQPAPRGTTSSTALAAWADAPLSPGRWTYQRGRPGQTRASYGPPGAPSFQIACDPGRLLALTRAGAAAGGLTLRTSSAAYTLPGAATAQGLRAQLPANDPLFDALAFSRGRFAVEAAGRPQLVIPTWPELARVVEDCRR